MANVQYFLTYHAIERFQERFPELAKESTKLKSWKRPQDVHTVKDFFDNLVSESEENRAYFNNSNYMINMYETYGYDTEYKFMENLKYGILFVIAKERHENHFRLVTIMPTEFRKKFSLNTIKYNEKEKKEDKKQKKILEVYDQYKKTTLSFENHHLSMINRLTELEKHENFDKLLSKNLSEFLIELTRLEQQKNKKGSQLQFSSTSYSYSFIVKENYATVLEIKKLSEVEIFERINYFKITEQILALLKKSELKEQYNKHVALRSVIVNYMRYYFKYYENLHQIELVNTELISEKELLDYALTTDVVETIKDNISKQYFVADETNSKIYHTYIENKKFTYCATNSIIEILKVEYLNYDAVNMDYELLKNKLIHMCSSNQTSIIKVITSNKKLRKAKIDNKEIVFMHFSKTQQIILISINSISSVMSDNYLDDNINYDKAYIEQFKSLTESLSREDELFFKKCASEENMIKAINKRKSIHRLQYKGDCYDFLLNKTKNEGYLITVLKKEA